MHDILEGAVRMNFALLMNYLTTNKILNAEKLNDALKSFKYGRIDKTNEVPSNLFTKDSAYLISATHQWMLMRLFPLLFGELLKNNEYFLHFVSLSEIFLSLMDETFNLDKIIMRIKIDNYLKKYLELYPDDKLKPKQHFLIHYPRAILNFGPPKFYWMMRFEAKHSYFKRTDQALHNHCNQLKSLAVRHQNLQVYHLISPCLFIDLDLGSPQRHKNVHNIDLIEILMNNKKFNLFNWVKKKALNIKLVNGDIILTKKQVLPRFSSIQSIIVSCEKLIFLVSDLKTIEYISYKASYKLEEVEVMQKLFHYCLKKSNNNQ